MFLFMIKYFHRKQRLQNGRDETEARRKEVAAPEGDGGKTQRARPGPYETRNQDHNSTPILDHRLKLFW